MPRPYFNRNWVLGCGVVGLVAEFADFASDSDCRHLPPGAQHRRFIDNTVVRATTGIVRGESAMEVCGAATAFGNRAQDRFVARANEM